MDFVFLDSKEICGTLFYLDTLDKVVEFESSTIGGISI